MTPIPEEPVRPENGLLMQKIPCLEIRARIARKFRGFLFFRCLKCRNPAPDCVKNVAKMMAIGIVVKRQCRF